jgi:hypothetical protein
VFGGITAPGGEGGGAGSSTATNSLSTGNKGESVAPTGADKNITGGFGGRGRVISGQCLFTATGGEAGGPGPGRVATVASAATIGTPGNVPGGGASGTFAGAAALNGAPGGRGEIRIRCYF